MTTGSVTVGLGVFRRMMAGMFGQSHSGARNLYASFGYHEQITVDHLFGMYYRGGIASRIVRAFPKATWRDAPVVRDEKGDSAQKTTEKKGANESYSPFVEAVEDFFERHKVYQCLERVDRLSGVGEYAIMVMGFAGSDGMDKPLVGKSDLLFLQPYGQRNITISQWETNQNSPRYGLPTLYSVSQARSMTGGNSVSNSLTVHHSRVLHVAEALDDNEVFGVPRLYPVMNYLMDLEKVVGAGAETFWLNSRQGTALVADADANLSEDDLAGMKEQATEFEHQLRRMMTLRGVTPHVLNAAVADPGPLLEKLLDLIAGTAEIPKRILTGSERGELSSDQDENNWSERIAERRENFASSTMLRPFVKTLIETGNLPAPAGEFWIEWPDGGALSPEKKADIAVKKSQALATYANSPGAEFVVPMQEFRTDFLDMAPESEYEMPEEPEEIDENDEEVADQFGKAKGEDDAEFGKEAEAEAGAGKVKANRAARL